MSVPCGQCIACRVARTQQWTTRLMHEASMHEASCFTTLTFDPEHVPFLGSIDRRHVQLFMKRLRKALGEGLRFFAAGEYGEQSNRPHYHVILFGTDFRADRVPHRRSSTGHMLYRSPLLERLWPFGISSIGDLTTASAGYVAAYTVKKITGDGALAHERYRRCESESGVQWYVEREFILMSNRPGIGASWFDQYEGDCFPSDFVVVDGQRRPVPAYYLKLRERRLGGLSEPGQYATAADIATVALKQRRHAKAAKHADEQVTIRQMTKHESNELRVARWERNIDDD